MAAAPVMPADGTEDHETGFVLKLPETVIVWAESLKLLPSLLIVSVTVHVEPLPPNAIRLMSPVGFTNVGAWLPRV